MAWQAALAVMAVAAVVSPCQSQVPQGHDSYYTAGQEEIVRRVAALNQQRTTRAKNVILFVADGNGISTNFATRLWAGQNNRPPFARDRPGRAGWASASTAQPHDLINQVPPHAAGQSNYGDEHVLPHEQMPHLALSKTYNTNAQTPDSAGTATAFNTGVKSKAGVISVRSGLRRGYCEDVAPHMAETFAEMVKRTQQKAVGVVTTARITHATPAAVYAHSSDRNFEAEVIVREHETIEHYADTGSQTCSQKDIAMQLIDAMLGNGSAYATVDVALGGGRQCFFDRTQTGPEGHHGKRSDGIDLIQRFQDAGGNYVWNSSGLQALRSSWAAQAAAGGSLPPVLGLFEPSHMEYEFERSVHGTDPSHSQEPPLWELTAAAIDALELKGGDQGYYLMVEGGRVDHSNHEGNLFRTVADGMAYQEAIQYALDHTSAEDTLIISTADHSHGLEYNGYCGRGSPINGLCYEIDNLGEQFLQTPNLAADGLPYTAAAFLNGAGSLLMEGGSNQLLPPQIVQGGNSVVRGHRRTLSADMAISRDFHQEAFLPRSSESHSPTDVAIYARGPWAHLIDGTMEQNMIFHVMKYAVENGATNPCPNGLAIEPGKCNCAGDVVDVCGVCGGSGIPLGACDCVGHVLDDCNVCGGYGKDVCGVCGGGGIPAGKCNCAGDMLDCAGVCGGPSVVDDCGICRDPTDLSSGSTLCVPSNTSAGGFSFGWFLCSTLFGVALTLLVQKAIPLVTRKQIDPIEMASLKNVRNSDYDVADQ